MLQLRFVLVRCLLLPAIMLVSFHLTLAQEIQQPSENSIGVQIDNSQVKDINGTEHPLLKDELEATVIIFMGWECPIMRQYVPRLKELRAEFQGRGVRWLAINSNQHDSLSELQYFAKSFNFDFPILKDVGNRLADQFAARRTPEVFLLGSNNRIVYQGRIDDQFTYGRQRPDVVTQFLANAIEETLSGERVSQEYVEPAGCIIGRVFKTGEKANVVPTVTYSNQISRIMQKNCSSCHREGEIGPFELMDYEEVVGWAGMIQEVVNERRMPPWHANPDYGNFSNDCRLTEDEIEMINHWVDDGAPQGNPADLPHPIERTQGWQIGQPDLVIAMSKRPFRVPATGTVDYEYFEVETGLTEDKWITAAECREGNRAVIHHIIVGIRGEGDFEGRRRGVHSELQSDWIAASAPGSPPMVLPKGYAKFLPAGSKLIFQVHYTPNGTATTDISSIGLKFANPDEVTHRVSTMKAFNEEFVIPAGDGNFRVSARFRFDRDAELLSFFPHMHLRGKSFKYTAVYPNAEQEVLLDVPAYDFNWQNAYLLTEPMAIPKATRIKCVAHFDNSEDNFANPDPTDYVRWGDQTWEEMMIGYFNVAVPISR